MVRGPSPPPTLKIFEMQIRQEEIDSRRLGWLSNVLKGIKDWRTPRLLPECELTYVSVKSATASGSASKPSLQGLSGKLILQGT